MNNQRIQNDSLYDDGNENNFDEIVSNRKRKGRHKKITALFILFLMIVIGVYLCNSEILVVNKVSVESLEEGKEVNLPYSQTELMSGFGLEKGMGLYKFSSKELEHNAKYNLTYIKDLKISRRWPSTVVAKVIPENLRYYITIDEKMYILSDELRVVDSTDNIEQVEINKLIYLKVENIRSCIKGVKLDVGDDIEKIIIDVANTLESENVLSSITEIDVSTKFDIRLMYDTRFAVKLGDSMDLKNKVKMMKEIVRDKEGELASGTIDVTKDYGKTGSLSKFT